MKRSEFVNLIAVLNHVATELDPTDHDSDFKLMVISNRKLSKDTFDSLKETVEGDLKEFVKERITLEDKFAVKDENDKPIMFTVDSQKGLATAYTSHFGVIRIVHNKIDKKDREKYDEALKGLLEKYKEEFTKVEAFLDKEASPIVLEKVSHKSIPKNIGYDLMEVLMPVIVKGK